MKTCVFYGNCQVIYNVHDMLNSIPEFRKEYHSIRYVNHDRDQITELSNIRIEDLINCDLFIYQPLGDNHGVFATENVKKYLKKECITISFPYIYNSSFYSVYWEKATTRWTIGTLVNCGWRHIMSLILSGVDLNMIINMFNNKEIDFYFKDRLDTCMNSLTSKEENCDIKVTDFIISNYKDRRLFITQNHISSYFTKWVCNKILGILSFNLIPENNEQDLTVEESCVFDQYTNEYYKFNYDTTVISNDESTISKIKEFYDFFINEKNNYKKNDFSLYKIIDDPEKFKDLPY